MRTLPRFVLSAIVVPVALIGLCVDGLGRLHAQDKSAHSLAGAWTLNKDLSDAPADRSADGDRGDRGDGGGGGRRGGFGGGGVGRGDGGRAAVSPEEMARQRDATGDIMNPPDHLMITETATMILINGPDGRTTRLSPDGKKIKDESTKIERKTKWDGGKLISEISGLAAGTITETYSVDSEHHQLHRTLQMERARRSLMTSRVYDADPR